MAVDGYRSVSAASTCYILPYFTPPPLGSLLLAAWRLQVDGLPPGVLVAVDVAFLLHSGDLGQSQDRGRGQGRMPHSLITRPPAQTRRRQVLHVQSQSEWAPLCIGPYAQANVIHDSLVFVAGQIALDPATMTIRTPLASDDGEQRLRLLAEQLRLALRHVSRILQCVGGALNHAGLCTVYLSRECVTAGSGWQAVAKVVYRGLGDAVVSDEGSERSRGGGGGEPAARRWHESRDYDVLSESEEEEDVGSGGPGQGNAAKGILSGCKRIPFPVVVVVVEALPRGALVEVEVVGLTDLCVETCPNVKQTSETKYGLAMDLGGRCDGQVRTGTNGDSASVMGMLDRSIWAASWRASDPETVFDDGGEGGEKVLSGE
eukprot:gene3368-4175_t